MSYSFKDLKVYKLAFSLAMEIFEISKGFPKEEKYALTDQIRRSSRSVCSNIAEGYRKRRYPKHFTSKMTDADGEASETSTWIDFAFSCAYISKDLQESLNNRYDDVGKMLGSMANNPDRFLPKVIEFSVAEDGGSDSSSSSGSSSGSG
ncbi:MAG: four helix bundle protein [Chloroflexia bacterium]|nr:four helix bundle protein [Chloroflexia bacterium]